MKKWKCVNIECKNYCVLRSNVKPAACVEDPFGPHEWQEMGETNQLPKLTAEVFDRPDCPEWANWAAVDEDGMACYFSDKPTILLENFWSRCKQHALVSLRERYDASDWRNSLIGRPAKALPEWCKVGEYGYAYDSGYFKIIEIIDCGKNLKVDWVKEGVQGTVFGCNLKCKKQARLRPYNADEMKSLVGKVLKHDTGNYLVTAFEYRWDQIKVESVWRDADELLQNWVHLDKTPCGVLEHLEDGEWVE